MVAPSAPDRPRRSTRSRHRGAPFDAFADIALHIHEGTTELTDVLNLIAESATALLRTDIAWLVLVDPAAQRARPVVLVGFSGPLFLEQSVPLHRGVIGQALRRRETVVVEDYVAYSHPTTKAVRSAVDEEGIRSMICCPLIRGEQWIGGLYVARRRPSSFGDDDVRLLEALAGQAAVAIENHRLYEQLREQNAALEGSLRVHSQFTDAVLRGVGIEGIAEILSGLIDRPVRIDGGSLAPPTTVEPAGTSADRCARRMTERIKADRRTLGTLEVFHSDELTPIEVTAIEHARTVCALELVKLGYAAEIERSYNSRLLDDLLDDALDAASLANRAKRLRVNLDQGFRLLVVRGELPAAHAAATEELVQGALRGEFGNRRTQVLVTKRASEIVVAVPATMQAACSSLVERIVAALAGAGGRGAVGIGPLGPSVPGGFRAASACASLGVRSAAESQQVRIISYDNLGLLNFLLDAPSLEHTRTAVGRILETLRQHDASNRLQLLPTLREYLAADGHHARTCAQLFIGATTLKYRLGRIEELLAVDLRDGDTRFRLRLAMELLEVLDVVR